MVGKKIIIHIVKILIAGFFALVLLTLFCLIYKNDPVHYPDPDGATDYRWTPNYFRSQATEGFSWGKTNNEGYYNFKDYNTNDHIDILIMGSSQMEASNVRPEESTAALLEKKLGNCLVYNIGVSGHYLPICACNLEKALQKYNPSSYVVIETGTLSFSEEELQLAIEGKIPEISSKNDGIIGFLQKNQFLRLIYHQYQSVNGNEQNDDVSRENIIAPEKSMNQEENNLLTELLTNMNNKIIKNNARMIVLYHPSTSLNIDGSLNIGGNLEEISEFKQICEENNILFLDMSKRFADEYEANYILPYGFANTSVGSGHLNSYGHAMIADELYRMIREVNR